MKPNNNYKLLGIATALTVVIIVYYRRPDPAKAQQVDKFLKKFDERQSWYDTMFAAY